ncbi:unnamed protein product [Protopolystoma xenopodis]|uniref:Uncharacterized protein n=1 Tax=Protopolystoma xenopodis TaxID=117903 RepID=A0A448XKA7_9PLAT|nr:unnamed protein product [Protopolystoma xenopodis]
MVVRAETNASVPSNARSWELIICGKVTGRNEGTLQQFMRAFRILRRSSPMRLRRLISTASAWLLRQPRMTDPSRPIGSRTVMRLQPADSKTYRFPCPEAAYDDRRIPA